MQARCAAPLLAAFLLLLSAPVRAADPPPHISVRLAYDHGPGVEGCPDERGFRYALMEKFGYDPTERPLIADFEAPPLLQVAIARRGAELRASATLLKTSGGVLWGDQYQSRIDCAGLVRIFALVIKIGIDAADVPRQPAAPLPPSPSPPPLPPALVPVGVLAEPPRTLPPSPFPKLRLGLGTGIAFGVAPAPAVDLSLQVGIRWPVVSLSLEGRADLPASSEATGIRTSLLAGTLVPCVHVFEYGAACALFSVGSRRASLLDESSSGRDVYAGAGARLGIEVPFAGRWVARLSGDLLATVRPTRVRVGLTKTELWTTPAVSGGPGIGLLVNFDSL